MTHKECWAGYRLKKAFSWAGRFGLTRKEGFHNEEEGKNKSPSVAVQTNGSAAPAVRR
jgi:hypothetical protein